MKKKAFSGGLLVLPDSSEEISQLRMMLVDDEAELPEPSKGTSVQEGVDLLLVPSFKDVREKDGHLVFDAVLSGEDVDRDTEWVNQDSLKAVYEIYRRNPVLMYMHSWIDVVGRMLDFDQDSASTSGERQSYGTFMLGKDFHFNQMGVKMHIDDLREKVVQKILSSLSISFNAKRIIEDGEPSELFLTDWFETSLVTVPSYRKAQIIHAYFEGARGNLDLPHNFYRALYLGEHVELPDFNAPAVKPEGQKQGQLAEEEVDFLQGIVDSLDEDWKNSMPARAEAGGDEALTAMLGEIERAGRVD